MRQHGEGWRASRDFPARRVRGHRRFGDCAWGSNGAGNPDLCGDGSAGASYSAWFGLFAPRGTPNDIVGKLNAAVVEALADPAVRSRLVQLGIEIFPRDQQTPRVLGALVKAGAEKWWPIIKAANIKAE